MHRGKAIAASAVAAVALLLMLWGSGSGTPVLSTPTGSASPAEGQSRTYQPPDDAVVTVEPVDSTLGERAAPALDWLMVFFALVVLVIVVKFLQWLLRRDWEQSEAPAEDDLSDDLDLLLAATSESARGAALAEGEPRNVVVRAWVALEDAAAASGLARDPAETAADFTHRFLGTWQVDEATTQELGELYREARFSRHPIPATTSERAVHLVGLIHDQLREARAAAEPPTAEPAAHAPPNSPGRGNSTTDRGADQ